MLVALLVLVAPFAWALPVGVLDDAGSGADAPADPAAALPLAFGSYKANMTPGDADWFAFGPASSGSCVEARVTTPHAMRVALEVVGDGSLVGIPDGDGLFGRVLAVPAAQVRLGALPDETPWEAASVGPYAFEVSSRQPVVGDSKQHDAPATASLAGPAPGSCFSGNLRSDGPDVDVWSFNASALDVVTYSFASDGPGALAILDHDGTKLAELVGSGLGEISVPEAGTYYVTASSVTTEDALYVVGLTIGPDPGSGCRPQCLV